MITVLLQMAALIACGVLWRFVRPGGFDADSVRRVLATLVYYLLLPALVLVVLWTSPIGLDSLRISFVAASCVLAGMVLSWQICRLCGTTKAARGAMILAAAFPNATYLGLPVLEATLGKWARSVAIQYDLFACLPLLLTVGMLVAQAHGDSAERPHPLRSLLRVPPLWAAVLAVALNKSGVPLPQGLAETLRMLAAGVVPLMLLSLGMSLRWDTMLTVHTRAVLPVLVIQLFIQPALAVALAHGVGLSGQVLVAVVLEAAMPSMVLGIVISDRYGLDTPLYAAAVTLSTLCSLVTLPLWFGWLS